MIERIRIALPLAIVAALVLAARPSLGFWPDGNDRFRAVHDYAVEEGFVGGFPNFYEEDYGSGPVYGVVLLDATAALHRDIPAAELGFPASTGDLHRAVYDWAHDHGYVGGFPNHHSADYGNGTVYGAILIKPGAGEWRDVPASELGNVEGRENLFRAVHDYAVDQTYLAGFSTAGCWTRLCVPSPIYEHFEGGFPNLHHADYGQGRVWGTILLRPGGAEWRDVPVGDLYGASTGFAPVVDGFPFRNHFEVPLVLPLPGFGTVELDPIEYGLCGGMIYSALDNYTFEQTTGLGSTMPGDTTPPEEGTELWSYLWERQIDSLSSDDWAPVRKLADWIYRKLETLRERSLDEFELNVRPLLDAGQPVPLLLVRANGDDMWDPSSAFSMNHQVLAIGYQAIPSAAGGFEWEIEIYDPNCPRARHHLYPRTGAETCDPDRTFRGLFPTEYGYVEPYWTPDPPTPGPKPDPCTLLGTCRSL